jgi:hypothetical protein
MFSCTHSMGQLPVYYILVNLKDFINTEFLLSVTKKELFQEMLSKLQFRNIWVNISEAGIAQSV